MSELTGYWQVNLKDMVAVLGEDEVKTILSGFSCPHNADVEDFIRAKAIQFGKQGIAATFLVFTSHQGKPVLIGYYALANKTITVKANALNSSWRQRIRRFGTYDEEYKQFQVAMPLIGQLGKNAANNYGKLIDGSELLKMACARVYEVQRVLGGRFVYLECEDTDFLKTFYEKNGFIKFANRNLDGDEVSSDGKQYLVQMIKYLKDSEYGSPEQTAQS